MLKTSNPTAPVSLKGLLLRHDVALLLLLFVAIAFGALSLYFAATHARSTQALGALRLSLQRADGVLTDALRDATHSVAMLDRAGEARWQQHQLRLDEEIRAWRTAAGHYLPASAVAAVIEALEPIRGDISRLFRGGPMAREARRLQLLGTPYRESRIAAFEAAAKAALQSLAERQAGDSGQFANRIRGLLLVLPVPFLLALVLALRSRVALDRQVIVPLRSLGTAAAAISDQQLQHRAPVSGAHEMVELAGSINAMAQALAESRAALARRERQAALGALVPVVAHNIRNPLASIRATAQVLEVGADEDELAESRQSIIDTVDRLERWVGGLLTYLGPLNPARSSVGLREVLEEVKRLLAHLAEIRGIGIRLAGLGDASPRVCADPALLEQAVHGLALNAVEAATAESTVDLEWQEDTATLVVRNEGERLAFEPRPQVELRPGPSSKRRGTGLGIPFAFKVCEAHGWRLSFEEPAPGITCVSIRFNPPTEACRV